MTMLVTDIDVTQSEPELFGEVLLACDMLTSNGMLSISLSQAIVAEIMHYHFGKPGIASHYQKRVRAAASDLHSSYKCLLLVHLLL